MQPPPAGRYHSLDALRAAMMLLGLLFHSTLFYMKAPPWASHDAQNSVLFDFVYYFIRFRMPVFFAVAGFFGALLYYRAGVARFLRNRAVRVLAPLAIFWVLTIPATGFGFRFTFRQFGVDVQWLLLYPDRLFLQQPILGHLWFLYDLVLLYAAAALLVPLASRVPAAMRARAHRLFGATATTPWGTLLLTGLSVLTLLPMQTDEIDRSGALLPPIRELVAYGVFFAFGWCLHRQRDLLPLFAIRWQWPLGTGIAAAAAYALLIIERPFADEGLLRLAAFCLLSLSSWLLIFGSLGVFLRYMDKPRPLVRYFADASYWMYLTHTIPVAWIPGLLAGYSAPAVVKFAIVLGATTIVTAVTYHYGVRSTSVGELLNGRRYPHTLPWTAPSASSRSSNVATESS